jgi:hypothetical protein
MQIREKVVVSLAVAAVVGLLAAPSAMATGSYSCSSFAPTVTILAGPCPVTSANPTACEQEGSSTGYTGIQYQITGSPDHVATVVTGDNTVVSVPAIQFYAACAGDPLTGLGRYSCHERAVKVNPDPYTSKFWLVVAGQKTGVLQSLAAKKGSCVKSVAVTGLGLPYNPFQAAQKVETVNFKGCAVRFEYNVVTGAVVSAALDPTQSSKPLCGPSQNDGTCCAFNGGEDVSHLELTLNGQPLGSGQFGDGYVSSGTNSCTTRVIGGRVYTWGSPCPE